MLVVAAAAALLGLNLVLARWSLPSRPTERSHRAASLLAGCWVVLALLPVHNFTHRSSAAAVTGLNAQTAIELVAFGGAGVLAVHLLRTTVPFVPVGAGLMVLPVWVVASTTWSATPAYALARGLEYFALAALAVATAGLVAVHPSLVDHVARCFLRWTAWATVALTVLGYALGPLFVVVLASNAHRFTWAGAHPTESGFVLGIAFLVLLGTDRQALRMSPVVRGGALLLTAIALYENQSRTVLAGIVAGGAVLLWLWRRADPERTEAVGFFLGAGSIAGGLLAGGAVWSYVLRGEGTERLTTLNGRTDLWDIGLAALDSPMRWLHGLGFGATRTLFLEDAAFAGNAHNSLLGTLVSLGVVGVALLVAGLVQVGIALHRGGATLQPLGRAAAALVAYTVVSAVTKDSLAEPHFGLSVVYLVAALAAGWCTGARLDLDRLTEPPSGRPHLPARRHR